MNDDEARMKVREMIRDIGTSMFVTVDEQGCLRSLPMRHISFDQATDTVWFFTSAGSPKA